MSKAPEEPSPEMVSLAEAVQIALRKAEGSGLRGHALMEVATGVDAKVVATRTNVVQIALTLLANGIRRAASRADGQGLVRVATAVVDDDAGLDVADNGPPIASDQIVGIFKPFGAGGRLHGAGVGLAISKRIAAELGGELQIAATTQQETCFRVRLPLAREAGR